MLRARTIRHSASAYFQRDYSASPQFELPHSAYSSQLEEKRVRIQRPSQPPVSSLFPQALSGGPRRRRCSVAFLVVLLLCCLSLWVFRGAYLDTSTRILDLYGSSFAFLQDVSSQEVGPRTKSASKLKPHPATATHRDEPVNDNRSLRWPPMVTKIPETRPDPSTLHAGLTPSSIDAQFCNGAHPCRILLPLWIGEQESRARMHLAQVLQLARTLNRTLVLPNVGRSRIGVCGKWEFDVYYDVGSFVGRGANAQEDEQRKVKKVMLMDDFRTWLEMRPEGPQGQVVFVDEAQRNEAGRYAKWSDASLVEGDGMLDVHVDGYALSLDDPRLKMVRCLGSKFHQLQFDQYTPVTVHIPFPEHQKPLPDGDLLVRSLSRTSVARAAYQTAELPSDTGDGEDSMLPPSPEVLVLHWNLRHFPFGPGTLESVTVGQINTDLDYSSNIHTLVQRLIAPYKAYLAVHWRMETVAPLMLPACAEALVDTLGTLLADPTLGKDIQTVWFASDFPWPVSSSVEGPTAQDVEMALDDQMEQQQQQSIALSARRSHTFRSVSREHVDAIGTLKAAFRTGGVLEGYRLTGVTEELDRVRREVEREGKLYVLEEDDEDGVLLEDPGVLGILDKLAAMKAALFVSGAKRCGRVSTFTRQITDSRATVRGSDERRNVVEVFG